MAEIDFAVKVRQWVDKANKNAEKAFRGIATEAVGRVKELTPVDTGFLRANFIDVLSIEAVPKPSQAPTEGLAIREAKIGDVIYVVNPVPYARRIEYGFAGKDSLGRTFNTRGRGMVQQTVAEMPQIARRVVEELK